MGLLTLLGVPADVVLVCEDRGQEGRAVVATESNHHEAAGTEHGLAGGV